MLGALTFEFPQVSLRRGCWGDLDTGLVNKKVGGVGPKGGGIGSGGAGGGAVEVVGLEVVGLEVVGIEMVRLEFVGWRWWG